MEREALPELPGPPPEAKPRRFRWNRMLAIVLTLPGVTLLAIFLETDEMILEWALVHEDPIQPVDVVLIDNTFSIDTAVRLLNEGTVKQILVGKAPPLSFSTEGPPVSVQSYILKELNLYDIPESAVATLPRAATSMLDRQQVLRDWMLEHEAGSMLVFTNRLHSAYTHSILTDTFEPVHIEARVHPAGRMKGVWRKQMLGLQNMMIRWLFWRWNYRSAIRAEGEALLQARSLPSQRNPHLQQDEGQ